MRLELVSEYIDDSVPLQDAIDPGHLIIVNVRDEFIEQRESIRCRPRVMRHCGAARTAVGA